MDEFRIYKTVHFSKEWEEQMIAMYQKQYLSEKFTFIYYNVVDMNNDPKHSFYILGVLNNKVIACCFVNTYSNYDKDEKIHRFDEYLISSLIVDKDYQRKGYGTKLIEATIKILKEENAIKVCAFAGDNSKRLFEKLEFVKDESIKSFGTIVPGEDTDVYYELNLESNFYLAPINEADCFIVGKSMSKQLLEHIDENSNIPLSLLPSASMYKQEILKNSTYDNSLVKVVRCNKMVAGYAYMYYQDYEITWNESHHYVTLSFYLKDEYLYISAVKVIVEEVIKFYKLNKEHHNIEYIKVVLNKWTIVMSKYDFYKRCLLDLGFEQKDNELFILNVC